MKNNKARLRNLVGIAGCVALIALLLVAYFRENHSNEYILHHGGSTGTILFDGDLVYDGAGSLNLMDGVVTNDGKGNSANDRVAVIITADGTLAQKTVRYTFTDEVGNTITEKRNLILNDYRGPELQVSSKLSLTADDLPDLITVLQSKGLLKAENGYGKEITDAVTCVRIHKSDSLYEMTFSLTNEFSDTITVTRVAEITGKVADPEIRLKKTQVAVNKGSYFDPYEWIKSANNGASDVSADAVEVHASVNVDVPGTYTVTYRLFNSDRTAKTEQTLNVTVR